MHNSPADLSSYLDNNTSQNVQDQALSKSMMHRKMLSVSEDVNTDLTIKTSEGDIVKLSTTSFYAFKSLLYDKKGRIYSDAGMITNRETYRQMTLASGENFTFSVAGDLNEQELNDIKKIVKQIDFIINDMKQGDMDNAVEKALSMGGYDTVSGFSADLSVKQSYSMVSETMIQEKKYIPEMNLLEKADKLAEKMRKKLDNMEETLLKRAQQPIDQLFGHHFKNFWDNQDKRLNPINAFLEQLQ